MFMSKNKHLNFIANNVYSEPLCCEICKELKNEHEMKNHMITHTYKYDNSELKCEECGFTGKNGWSMQMHHRKWYSKNIECGLCEFKVKDKGKKVTQPTKFQYFLLLKFNQKGEKKSLKKCYDFSLFWSDMSKEVYITIISLWKPQI